MEELAQDTPDGRCIGSQIENVDELLRRVAPMPKEKLAGLSREAFIPAMKEANASRSTFVPGSRDNGGLSTKRESQSAEAAYAEYTKGGRVAIGVFGVTVGEFAEAGRANEVEVPVYSDAGLKPDGSDEALPAHHASVWYPVAATDAERSRIKNKHDRIARAVLKVARELYRPKHE